MTSKTNRYHSPVVNLILPALGSGFGAGGGGGGGGGPSPTAMLL